MGLNETVKRMRELLAGLSVDLEKSVGGNKAASQRVRTSTIKLEKVAKKYRKESISDEKRGGPKKKAKAKAKPKAKAPAKAAKKPQAKAKAPTKAKAKPAKAKAKAAKKPMMMKRPTAKIPSRRK